LGPLDITADVMTNRWNRISEGHGYCWSQSKGHRENTGQVVLKAALSLLVEHQPTDDPTS
jgi:hypothetical protein